MKKIKIMITAALFIVITAVTAFALTNDQIITIVGSVLSDTGYQVHVMIDDFDNNKINDIIIVYISGNETNTKAMFIGAVSGSIVIPAREANVKLDKALIIMSKSEVWAARISHLDECYQLLRDTDSNEKAGVCLLAAWVKVDL